MGSEKRVAFSERQNSVFAPDEFFRAEQLQEVLEHLALCNADHQREESDVPNVVDKDLLHEPVVVRQGDILVNLEL